MFGSNTVEDWSKLRFLLEHLVWRDVYGANSKCTHHSLRLPLVVVNTLALVEFVHMDISFQAVEIQKPTRRELNVHLLNKFLHLDEFNSSNFTYFPWITSFLDCMSPVARHFVYLLVAPFLVFASFLSSEIMSLIMVERNQNVLSTGNYTRCQYIKHWFPYYLSNSSSLSLKRLFRMLMMCPSIGVGSCAIIFWPEIAWTSYDLNFFLGGEQP